MTEEVFTYKSPGTLIVDPVPKTGNVLKMYEPFWMMAIVPGDVCNYYRHQLEVRYGLKLQKPGWGSHVSIIAGETRYPSNYDAVLSASKKYFKNNPKSEPESVYLHLLDKGLVTLEELANWENLKKKYHKKKVEFEYEIGPKTIGKHWWLRVRSEEFKDIREEFGYPRDAYWGLHMTLGIPHPLHMEYSYYLWENYKKFNWIY
jgi:hypothetical protein